jgi:hypothetical protein
MEFGLEMVKHTYVLCMTYFMYANKYEHVNSAERKKLCQRNNEQFITEIPDSPLPPTQNCGGVMGRG